MTQATWQLNAPTRSPRSSAGFSPRAAAWIQNFTRPGISLHASDPPIHQSHSDAVTFEAHNDGYEYAMLHISALLQSAHIEPNTAIRFIRVIEQLQKPGILFPRVTADDDGEAIAFWKAGRMSLEVSVPRQGDAYVRMTDAEGRELCVKFVPWLPAKELTRFLAQLTQFVEQVNPSWRSVFKS